VPDSPIQVPLSPCVLVIKTPVAARGWMAGRIAHATPDLAGQVTAAAEEQERTLQTVEEALSRHGVEPSRISADALDRKAGRALAAARLVVTVGGDGTLLAASQWVTGARLLGVNSAPGSSIGHLALAKRADFPGILESIASGALQPVPVTRLTVEVDGRRLRPALNDVLLTHAKPAATSRYRLSVGDQSEEHRSSGLWIATATGSTAGIRSAGGHPMPLRSRRIQFRARELYREAGGDLQLANGFLSPGAELAVESEMEQGFLFLDGARRATRFPFGARAIFRAAPEPLLLFADPGRWTKD
jgi:NAD+ kinase